MQTVPENYRQVLQNAIDTSREYLADSDDGHPPIVVLGCSKNKQIHFLSAPFANKIEKDLFAEAIKAYAKEYDADFFIFVSEAYILRAEQLGGNEAMEKLRAQFTSVKDCPGRVECLMFALETPYGNWIATPEIHTKNGKRTFDEPTFVKSDDASGRFTHLLPSHQPDDNQQPH